MYIHHAKNYTQKPYTSPHNPNTKRMDGYIRSEKKKGALKSYLLLHTQKTLTQTHTHAHMHTHIKVRLRTGRVHDPEKPLPELPRREFPPPRARWWSAERAF